MGFLSWPFEALIATGFVAGLASTLKFQPRGNGCFWLLIFPIFAVIFASFEFNKIPQDDLNSTASLVVMFAGVWVGFGVLGGYVVGLILNQRRNQGNDL